MTWTTGAYHKIVIADLRQLAEEVGSFSENQELEDQRYRFQEIRRFAKKIEDNCLLAIQLLHRQEQEERQRKLFGNATK